MLGEKTDEGLGCILWIVAIALATLFWSHGPEIADKILGH